MKIKSIYSLVKDAVKPHAHSAAKTIADYNREALIMQGNIQFKKLIEKGINIPVALL